MSPFRELTPAQRSIEIARWILLVPMAGVAGTIVQSVLGLILRAIPIGSGMESPTYWLRTIPGYAVPQLAIVVVGAWIAPRKPLLAAGLLTLLFGVLSLLKHVIVQAVVGNNVGTINFVHFGLETAGLIAGLICVRRWSAGQRMFDR